MGRWEPDARGRLASSALDLYGERGYEQTTVAEIAERAGLTARTFFRHFADKREVLFAGSEVLAQRLATALDAAPPDTPALDCVAAALEVVCGIIGGDHDHSRRRQAVIAAHDELQERELVKMMSWSRVAAEGLVRRGVDGATAGLAGETGVTVFRVAFERWVAGPPGASLSTTLHDSFALLRGLTRS